MYMNKNFLDYTGLAKYTQKLETFVTSKLSGLVPSSRKVNAKELTEDVNLTAYDVDAVPITRQINGHQLGFDLTLTAADLNAVPTSRTVNGKALMDDITLSAGDIEGLEVPDLSGYVPTSRTVNGKALTSNITLTATDIGVSEGVGESQYNVVVKPTSTTTVVAENGAEIFNDYRNRVFDGTRASEGNVASGTNAHAEGKATTASGNMSHAEGSSSVASGSVSHAENYSTASGDFSHAEGLETTASGRHSHAEGEGSIATHDDTHAEGYQSEASAIQAHAEGDSCKATGQKSHAEGYATTASGAESHAENLQTTASGAASHAEGIWTIASNRGSHASGQYNKAMTNGATPASLLGDVFVVGNGAGKTEAQRSNALRLAYEGTLYLTKAYNSTGADYAEYFEWLDDNPLGEDRVGRFVTLEGDKLKIAEPGDYILGVVSGQPCIIGNSDEDWLGRWEHDDFNRFVKEYLVHNEVEVTPPEDIVDDPHALHDWLLANDITEREGHYFKMETEVVDYPTASWRHKANPAYDPSQPYVERKDRQEWDAVGMVGVLSVLDDGTCLPNSYCKVTTNGIATAAVRHDTVDTWRVVARVTPNIVKIVFSIK